MNWWIVKQLRAAVLTDLRDFIPSGHFETGAEKFKFDDRMPNAAHFSREMKWGSLATELGKKLFYESGTMSPRQVAASEVLMRLGLLAATEAAHGAAAQLAKDAKANGVSDGNAGTVAKQMEAEHLPTLSDNLTGGLRQYLLHLTTAEAEPFLPLLVPVPDVLTRSANMKSPAEVPGHTTMNFHGPVGAVQTGPHATANVQQWVHGDPAALIEALQQLRSSVVAAPELVQADKDSLMADIDKAATELKAENPSKSKLAQWLGGVATTVQTIGSAKAAYDAVVAAAALLGLSL